jgi:hypothetical protein
MRNIGQQLLNTLINLINDLTQGVSSQFTHILLVSKIRSTIDKPPSLSHPNGSLGLVVGVLHQATSATSHHYQIMENQF